MISNSVILEKLEERTEGDERTKKTLLAILEAESEHRQYNKTLKPLIEADVKEARDEVQ